jgi:hypothetical protein
VKEKDPRESDGVIILGRDSRDETVEKKKKKKKRARIC